MTAARIALVTCKAFPRLAPDDQALQSWLSDQGHQVSVQVWDQPARWESFDLVIVRSCWDYHLKRDAFLRWIEDLERTAMPLQNPADLLQWNHDKRYLRDLEDEGIPTAATVWLERGSSADLMQILNQQGWHRAVLKPRVSATAWKTSMVSRTTAHEDQRILDALLTEENVMVQAFVDEIVQDGEWSFIYFNGERSHAVVKRARIGDFRVQEEFEGSVQAVQTDEDTWRQADAVVGTLPTIPLYARVDGPLVHGRLHVLELELIEPALYLATDPSAAARFGAAALRHL